MASDPNKKMERQTAIIDNAEALALGKMQYQQEKNHKGKKGNGKGRQGFSLSGMQSSGVSKQKKATKFAGNSTLKAPLKKSDSSNTESKTCPEALQFYRDDELRIPLNDKKGKKKINARDGRSMSARFSKSDLLAIVKDYGAETKAKEFEASRASKLVIGRWIEEVETRAFGAGPKLAAQKANTTSATKTLSVPEKAPESMATVGETSAVNLRKRVAPRSASQEHGKRKRDEEDVTMLLEQTPKKAKSLHQPGNRLQQRSACVSLDSQHTHESSTAHQSAQLEGPNASPPAPPHHRPAHLKQSIKRSQKEKQDLKVCRTVLDMFKYNNTKAIIEFLGLNPKWDPIRSPKGTPTHTLDLPSKACKVIITVTRESVILVDKIPYQDLDKHKAQTKTLNTPPSSQDLRDVACQQVCVNNTARPFLKPGVHGWDSENHRWSFGGDPGLFTGIGHQIEPEDESRLHEEGPNSEFYKEYQKMYPGHLASQWPCGCPRRYVDDDADSEEE